MRILSILTFVLTLFAFAACGPDSQDDADTIAVDMQGNTLVIGGGFGGEDTARQCTIIDSNGPLPGGTRTVTGCEDDEFCLAFACGGYSCVGTCRTPGPPPPKFPGR